MRCPATRRPPVRGRELLPGGAPLCGAASHEAEGRCGARGGGTGRVGPPTGWHRLRLLRQIGDQLVPGVEQFLLINNVVTVEDGAALVPGQEHGDPFGDIRADQVAGGGALERAFARFGGVPKELLFDQMRAVVLSDGRVGGGELVLNAEFLRVAAHWGFHPRACRPYRAQTKGKVERPIRYIRDSFFYGRAFANDEDLNEQASRWLEGTANVRRHSTTGERPVDRFERDEHEALGPLARRPYQRFGVQPATEPTRRRVPDTVKVERRSLRVYADAAG